jgi:uncharacterized protein YndB with AHSA1/START domain
MPATAKMPPIRKTIRVGVPATRAFDVFTAGMHRWWPAAHSILKVPRAAIAVEPRVGGRWYERGVDGSECTWGRVVAWDPPQRVVVTWQLNGDFIYDPEFETEVEIQFTPDGPDATRVDLEHRYLERYGEKADMIRPMMDSPEGWMSTLTSFAAAAEAAS